MYRGMENATEVPTLFRVKGSRSLGLITPTPNYSAPSKNRLCVVKGGVGGWGFVTRAGDTQSRNWSS